MLLQRDKKKMRGTKHVKHTILLMLLSSAVKKSVAQKIGSSCKMNELREKRELEKIAEKKKAKKKIGRCSNFEDLNSFVGGLSMTTQNAKNLKLACCFIWKSLESKKDTDMNEIDYEWMGFWVSVWWIAFVSTVVIAGDWDGPQ